MLRGRLSFDIETIPQEEHVRRCLGQPYDPSTFRVQHGAKDPDKIAAQRAQHEQEHAARMRAEADDGTLNALHGRVACWGWATDREAHSTIVDSELREASAINDVLHALNGNGLATWNGREFDLPFVLLRAAILGVSIPPRISRGWFQRYETSEHFDGYQLLRWKAGKMWSLEKASQALGIEPISLGNGKEIAALYAAGEFDAIRAKNLQDVRRTLKVTGILETAFPVD